jgi:DNA replication protein DnaC
MSHAKIPEEFWANKWDQANIPIKFRGLRLKDYDNPHESGRIAKEAAYEFIDNFENHFVSSKRASAGMFPSDRSNIGRGLLFVGPNGTRKSTLANAILTEVQYRNGNYHTHYVRFSDWKKALTDTFAKEDTEEKFLARKILRRVELATLVVLDDIGQEHRTSSGFTESSLHELLRVRYEAARPTIVTTNVSLSKISDTYGESFDSFRHDAFNTYPMVGADTRRIGK